MPSPKEKSSSMLGGRFNIASVRQSNNDIESMRLLLPPRLMIRQSATDIEAMRHFTPFESMARQAASEVESNHRHLPLTVEAVASQIERTQGRRLF